MVGVCLLRRIDTALATVSVTSRHHILSLSLCFYRLGRTSLELLLLMRHAILTLLVHLISSSVQRSLASPTKRIFSILCALVESSSLLCLPSLILELRVILSV